MSAGISTIDSQQPSLKSSRAPSWTSQSRLAFLVSAMLFMPAMARGEPSAAEDVVNKVNQALAAHWGEVSPAARCDDATFLRRVTLDLAGRIPRPDEVQRFLVSDAPDKREAVVKSLLEGGEFALHFGYVLDELIQERHAGNPAFISYLSQSLRARESPGAAGFRPPKSWDVIFRELMLGPWESDETKAANRFLDKRARDIDAMAADTARVFFGVDISCARCHDHPLVLDWTQEHYYGMAAFFARTTGGKGKVDEKKEGEVKFSPRGEDERVAAMRFLTGEPFTDPEPVIGPDGKSKPVSRRSELLRVALEEERFFSRALVNRLWDYFFGSGLVHPVDQMHSGNPPAIPEVLDLLAADFAEQGYDLQRLVSILVSIRLYHLDSRYNISASMPDPTLFAVMPLRPLQPRQLAASLLLATGPVEETKPIDTSDDGFSRLLDRAQDLEKTAPWMSAFDSRHGTFQSSTGETLLLSNHPAVHALVAPTEGRLAARLAKLESPDAVIDMAFLTVLSRRPTEAERDDLRSWLENRSQANEERCSELVWALATSAEFRFNH